MRLVVRAQPNARLTRVGGRYGDTEPPILRVRVQAPPVDGKANAAVVDAVARALGVAPSAVHIVAGHSTRTKTLVIDGADEALVARLLAAG